MRVLVTGASGFIGRRLIERLLADEWQVRAAVHRTEPPLPAGCDRVRVGELGPETDWCEALAGTEGVIHLAARAHVLQEPESDPLAAFRRVNVEATARLAEQAVAHGVERFVLISSIGVNGTCTDGRRAFRADDPPAPEEPYAQSKWEAEQALRRVTAGTNTESVVVRPPLVHGPGAGGNFQRLIRWVDRGVPLPLGAVQNARSLVGLDNLVDLLVKCLENPAAADGTFLVSDGEPLSTPDLIRRLGEAVGRPARLLPVPPSLLRFGGRLAGRSADVNRLIGSLEVDSRPTRVALGWVPPLSLDEGLRRAARAGSV